MNCIVENKHKKPLDTVNNVYYTYIDMKKWTPEEIKNLRDSLGLTQQALGDLVGVTRVYVNYLEKGVRSPSKTMCILLDCIKTKTRKESGKRGKRDL